MAVVIRKPIITVLGHVDSGKSTLLDTIRGTDVVAKEAGGITQHIGATEVPISIIRKLSGTLIEKYGFKITIPGLLFIDTPGHEAFTNLRKRGGSIADLAIVVVDITKGLQNQTVEAIEVLRTYKTPFIIAANKIDTLQGYKSAQRPFSENEGFQRQDIRQLLDEKIYVLVGQLYEKGFSAERFDRVRDFTKEIAIVPTCARTGEGIAEVLVFIAGLSQRFLEQRLAIEVKGPGRGTVLEVKEERGMGKTIDVIIYDGTVKVGEMIAVGGRNGVLTTKIKAILEPKPLEELRVSQEKFRSVKEVYAAAGIKIAASGLEDALAGSPMMVIESGNEAAQIADEIEKLKIESNANGPLIRADTLGGLEAMVKLLEQRGIIVRKADIGEVSRHDIMETESVKEKDPLKGVIFAFHCPVAREAREEADKRSIKIFCGNVIYRLLEEYDEWVAGEDARRKEEQIAKMTLPAKVRVLPGCIFRNSKPAIVGVRVLVGRLRPGVELMKDGKVIGRVLVVQSEGKQLSEVKAGEEVAVSIDKGVVEKNLFENDELCSYIPKKQLDVLDKACGLLTKPELELVGEIRKQETAKAGAAA